jgi:hypothetical protein
MVWVAEWQRREEVKSVKKVLTIQMKASSTDSCLGLCSPY